MVLLFFQECRLHSSSAFTGYPAFMRGGMLLSSASARCRSSSRADDRAEASGVGGSCNEDHGFTGWAPYIL